MKLEDDVAGAGIAGITQAVLLAGGVEDRAAGPDAVAGVHFNFALEDDDRDVVRIGVRRVAGSPVRGQSPCACSLRRTPVGPSRSFFVRTLDDDAALLAPRVSANERAVEVPERPAAVFDGRVAGSSASHLNIR
jgi:hypothetical protein